MCVEVNIECIYSRLLNQVYLNAIFYVMDSCTWKHRISWFYYRNCELNWNITALHTWHVEDFKHEEANHFFAFLYFVLVQCYFMFCLMFVRLLEWDFYCMFKMVWISLVNMVLCDRWALSDWQGNQPIIMLKKFHAFSLLLHYFSQVPGAFTLSAYQIPSDWPD